MGLFGSAKKSNGAFEFRVSDALEVPYRGYLLRLKLLSGEPTIGDLAPGERIRLRSPTGVERDVAVTDYSITQGVPSQKRFDRTRELDVLIAAADAVVDGEVVETGWTALRAN